jgi:hypothetical protein
MHRIAMLVILAGPMLGVENASYRESLGAIACKTPLDELCPRHLCVVFCKYNAVRIQHGFRKNA